MKADLLFHHPNPFIDDMLHGDVVEHDEHGNEVIHPGTPDREVVVIEPEPEPETDPAPELNADSDFALIGSLGDDRLVSDDYDTQVIIGGGGNDYLKGTYNAFSLLDGGPGDDTLVGNGQFNVLIGGPGRDVFHTGGYTTKIMDFQDGLDKIKITSDPPGDLSRFYQAIRDAGLQWDWDWVADVRAAGSEADEGLEIATDGEGDHTLILVGVDSDDLQFELVGDDLFIV